MSAANLVALRRRLLNWYETHKRALPWRRRSDPYAIWVSETMLQQTQVATVLPYYHRFMEAFPDIEALDRAPLAKVLALWSGLGYYRRAANLKKSARIVVARHRGRLPDDYDKLRALPGVGEYTAGALLSIAFGKPHPAVDGNARRVLGRIFLPADEKKLRDAAWSLISKTKPGQFNQSLMDLGSALCTPKSPRCTECPVATWCAAQKSRHRIQSRASKKKTESRLVIWPLAILRSNGKLLLRRRAAGGILGGLWELPGGERKNRPTAKTLLKEYFPRRRQIAGPALRLGEVAHNITNRRIRAPVYLIESAGAAKVRFDGSGWRWIAPASLDAQPTSAMTRKAIKLLNEYEKSLL